MERQGPEFAFELLSSVDDAIPRGQERIRVALQDVIRFAHYSQDRRQDAGPRVSGRLAPRAALAFSERIRREAELASTVEAGGPVAQMAQDQAAQLRALCEALPSSERRASAMEVFLFPVRHPEFGLPFGITWFHLFPAVRTRAGQLDGMVEDLDPSTLFPSRPPYAPSVRFVRISIELSILLSQLVKLNPSATRGYASPAARIGAYTRT